MVTTRFKTTNAILPAMKSNNKIPVELPQSISVESGWGRTMSAYRKNQNVYAQGDPADSEIIANRIIAAAKNGERDSVRLYEQALKVFGMGRYVDAGH